MDMERGKERNRTCSGHAVEARKEKVEQVVFGGGVRVLHRVVDAATSLVHLHVRRARQLHRHTRSHRRTHHTMQV